MRVYPRLIAAHFRRDGEHARPVASELPALDALLGGGLDRGTSTLLIGAAGAGKSSLASHFVRAAAERGERSAMFLFDESLRALLTRSKGIGFDIEARIGRRDRSTCSRSIRPNCRRANSSSASARRWKRTARSVVVIDSLNGYLNAMAEEHHVLIQLHELLSYLAQLDVTTILIASQAGLIGHMHTTLDVSYLADTVVLLRYFESRGEVKQAISVLKKRTGPHERTIRELRISSDGLDIGEPLRNFRGVLTGVPQEDDGHREVTHARRRGAGRVVNHPLPGPGLRARVLLLLPTARDADITCTILEDNGLVGHVCRDAAELRAELALGAGAVLVGEELLQGDGVHAAVAEALDVAGRVVGPAGADPDRRAARIRSRSAMRSRCSAT